MGNGWDDIIKKKYGKEAMFRLDEPGHVEDLDIVSSGSIALDYALQIGGYPRGRIVEIFGAQGSGKSTMALHAISSANEIGLDALYVDAEHSLDPNYAKAVGISFENTYVVQPDYGEQAIDILETAIKSKGIGVAVVDSVAALVPKAELEGETGDVHVGLQARMMSQAMRRLSGVIRKNNVLVVFINQYRDKISGYGFGGSKTTPGGHALRYYSSVRIEVVRTQNLKSGDIPFAQKVKATIVKNKLAAPYRVATFNIEFGVGIAKHIELIELGCDLGILKKSGSWIKSSDGVLSAQGISNAAEFLRENNDYYEQLRREIVSKLEL